jgi:iron complex transport system ATP-binding protein
MIDSEPFSAASAEPGLSVQGLRVQLGQRWVVDGVSFGAPAGAVTAIVGPNGSGKTTLLRALAGLLPYEGRVVSRALPDSSCELSALSAAERARRVAYLPQSSGLRAALSVREVVALGRYASRPGWFGAARGDDTLVEQALARTQIGELAERAYPRLSGGQQRLVLIARALATGARTLLLDEPTASLDVRHGLRLFELLAELAADGYCVVLVLHDLDDVQRHASHAVLLDAGRPRLVAAPHAPEFSRAAEETYGVRLVPADRLGFRKLAPRTEAAP